MTANKEVDAETQRLRKRGAWILWPALVWLLLVSTLSTIFALSSGGRQDAVALLREWFLLPTIPILILPLMSAGMWWICEGNRKQSIETLVRNHRWMLAACVIPPMLLTAAMPKIFLSHLALALDDWTLTFLLWWQFPTIAALLFSVGLILRYHRFEPQMVFRRTLVLSVALWWAMRLLEIAYVFSPSHRIQQLAVAADLFLHFAWVHSTLPLYFQLVLFGALGACILLDRRRRKRHAEPSARAPSAAHRPEQAPKTGKLADFEVVEKP